MSTTPKKTKERGVKKMKGRQRYERGVRESRVLQQQLDQQNYEIRLSQQANT